MTKKNENQEFVWVHEFNDDTVKEFYSEFCKMEQSSSVSVIPVVISSYGGSVHNLLAMRDIIKSSVKPVATIAVGKAMSAGAFLLAAGTKGFRYASPNTRIMLHEVSSGAWGKATEITADAKETEYLNDLLHDLLAEDTGQTAAYWKHRYKEQSNTDLYITAKLSKRLGLVDHVGVPRTVETSTYNLLRVPKSRKTRT